MPRSPLIRFAAAGFAGALAAASIIGILVLVNAEEGFSKCTAATGFGWIVPIIAGVVVAALSFALLRDRPRDQIQRTAPGQACCSVCGGIIRGDWRLCPHCGARFGALS